MSTIDVYRITNQLDDDTLEVIISRLETRAKHPRAIAIMEEYLDAMDIDRALNVLDVGCGTGVITRAIARRPNFKGKVIGVDLSPYLTHAAARLAAEEGVGHRTEFRSGDSQTLGIPDQCLDAVIAHTLLSHVSDPLAVLREIRRILKPGARVALFDGDFASMTFGSSDPVQGKHDEETIVNAMITQPRIMRQLPELLDAAGLKLIKSFGYVIADVGRMDYWGPAIESFRKVLPKTGAMSQAQANAWASSMVERSDRNIFFGASNYYTYIATL